MPILWPASHVHGQKGAIGPIVWIWAGASLVFVSISIIHATVSPGVEAVMVGWTLPTFVCAQTCCVLAWKGWSGWDPPTASAAVVLVLFSVETLSSVIHRRIVSWSSLARAMCVGYTFLHLRRLGPLEPSLDRWTSVSLFVGMIALCVRSIANGWSLMDGSSANHAVVVYLDLLSLLPLHLIALSAGVWGMAGNLDRTHGVSSGRRMVYMHVATLCSLVVFGIALRGVEPWLTVQWELVYSTGVGLDGGPRLLIQRALWIPLFLFVDQITSWSLCMWLQSRVTSTVQV